jgi:LPPG:FO 2-phospho-L-lactate transferase
VICVLSGGVGAAKFLRGLQQIVDPPSIVAVVNVGDDTVLHGLHVSADLDTVTYTLAGQINPDTGWGMRDETWQAMAGLRRYGAPAWFSLGDRDLGTHLYRTTRLRDGAPLSTVTAEIAAAWGIGVRIVPVTDQRLQTRVTVVDEGEIGFQDYFVRRRHDVAITGIRFDGAESCRPAPGVLEVIVEADQLVIAPSNPLVSIGPLLAVPGIRAAVEGRREHNVAVSPIVGDTALKGPADRMMRELGHAPTVVGVAAMYAPLVARLVIDEVDAHHADAVRRAGVEPVVADTIMADDQRAAAVAANVVAALT